MATVDIDHAALQAMFTDPEGPVGQMLEDKGYSVETLAKRNVASAGTGRLYDTYFFMRNGKLYSYGHRPPHQASSPGEPPATDTGRLLNSIGHALGSDGEGLYVDIFARTNYAEFLELGTRDMEARPFLRPALYEVADGDQSGPSVNSLGETYL